MLTAFLVPVLFCAAGGALHALWIRFSTWLAMVRAQGQALADGRNRELESKALRDHAEGRLRLSEAEVARLLEKAAGLEARLADEQRRGLEAQQHHLAERKLLAERVEKLEAKLEAARTAPSFVVTAKGIGDSTPPIGMGWRCGVDGNGRQVWWLE